MQKSKKKNSSPISPKQNALEIIKFRIVYDEDDLEPGNGVKFKPIMSHQVFGDKQSITGYRNLSITLTYLHNSCRCFVDIQNSDKITSCKKKADNIVKALKPWMPPGYTTSLPTFNKWMKNEKHNEMYGELVTAFADTKPMPKFPEVKATYKITKNEVTLENFSKFHARMQTYIIWFIDAANFIDLKDIKWVIYYIYEEFKHPLYKKLYRSPVGFCTVYRFYEFPSKLRPSISQVFVLPSHQKRGIGTKLYETVVNDQRSLENVIYTTVEDPSSTFRKVCDLEDCGVIHQELIRKKLSYFTVTPKYIFELGKTKKIDEIQMQRVTDILGLYSASKKWHHIAVLRTIQFRIFIEYEEESVEPSNSRKGTKKQEIETRFKKYRKAIEPSVEYLKKNMEEWLKRNRNRK